MIATLYGLNRKINASELVYRIEKIVLKYTFADNSYGRYVIHHLNISNQRRCSNLDDAALEEFVLRFLNFILTRKIVSDMEMVEFNRDVLEFLLEY